MNGTHPSADRRSGRWSASAPSRSMPTARRPPRAGRRREKRHRLVRLWIEPTPMSVSSTSSFKSRLLRPARPAAASSASATTSTRALARDLTSGTDDFADTLSCQFTIVTDHSYAFSTRSDNGSMLYVHRALVVDNNFDQGVTKRSGLRRCPRTAHDRNPLPSGGGGFGLGTSIRVPNTSGYRSICSRREQTLTIGFRAHIPRLATTGATVNVTVNRSTTRHPDRDGGRSIRQRRTRRAAVLCASASTFESGRRSPR